jgi:hypothetical protein
VREKFLLRQPPEYGFGWIKSRNMRSCSENRTNHEEPLLNRDISEADTAEADSNSGPNKMAKARVVECPEGEDSTRALAGCSRSARIC